MVIVQLDKASDTFSHILRKLSTKDSIDLCADQNKASSGVYPFLFNVTVETISAKKPFKMLNKYFKTKKHLVLPKHIVVNDGNRKLYFGPKNTRPTNLAKNKLQCTDLGNTYIVSKLTEAASYTNPYVRMTETTEDFTDEVQNVPDEMNDRDDSPENRGEAEHPTEKEVQHAPDKLDGMDETQVQINSRDGSPEMRREAEQQTEEVQHSPDDRTSSRNESPQMRREAEQQNEEVQHAPVQMNGRDESPEMTGDAENQSKNDSETAEVLIEEDNKNKEKTDSNDITATPAYDLGHGDTVTFNNQISENHEDNNSQTSSRARWTLSSPIIEDELSVSGCGNISARSHITQDVQNPFELEDTGNGISEDAETFTNNPDPSDPLDPDLVVNGNERSEDDGNNQSNIRMNPDPSDPSDPDPSDNDNDPDNSFTTFGTLNQEEARFQNMFLSPENCSNEWFIALIHITKAQFLDFVSRSTVQTAKNDNLTKYSKCLLFRLKLASNWSMDELAKVFGVGKTTARRIFWEVTQTVYVNSLGMPNLLEHDLDMEKLFEDIFETMDPYFKKLYMHLKDPTGMQNIFFENGVIYKDNLLLYYLKCNFPVCHPVCQSVCWSVAWTVIIL